VREPLAPLAFPLGLPEPTALTVLRAFPNLTFSRPVFVTHAPDGTDRLFVLEQAGRVRVFPNVDGVGTAETFLDLRPSAGGPVSFASDEEGLLGMAFAPDYATSGAFYVHYSAAGPRRSVIARYRVTGADPDAADPSSEEVILEVLQPYSNHNAGMIAFGPDEMLYVAMGDGGAGGDPHGYGQDTGALLGKMLRIDPTGGSPYAIPSDNPFVGVAGRDEIWATGCRNPWRFSFDRQTGDLWLGDVGQGAREEIDLVRRGDNLGWRVYEGDLEHDNPTGLPPSAFRSPVVAYGRSLGSTVIGGYVSRSDVLPDFRGAYLYGDHGSGRIWALVHDGTRVVSNEEVASLSGLASFGEDEAGEVLAVSLGGTLHRFRQSGGGGSGEVPATLSATGLFADTAALEPASGVIPFSVNAPLWSDGARKSRWIALPDGTTIGFSASGAWTFPVGTVLVKHFELDLSAGDPTTAWRIETRALVHESAGWRGYTYRWRADQTDADLMTNSEATFEALIVEDPLAPGGVRSQLYEIPSRADCLRCHTEAAGFVLGVRTSQLNGDHAYRSVTDNQLRSWNHVALFSTDVGDHAQYPALPDPSDLSVPPAPRARAYLDANCASCHRPGGPAPGGLDLRWTTIDAAMNVVNVRPTEGDLGLPDAWRVRPGSKESSVLWQRLRRTDDTRMPPLASHVADASAEQLIGAWIDGL
jgi:uncharacterized repeat protein (TIGR03806 family)